MVRYFKLLLTLSIVLVLTSCSDKTPDAKYVFLFIGDGMGQSQVYSTEIYKAALKGKINREKLCFSEFPIQSYCTTFSADDFITCSSAAATAIATGTKTKNSYIGVDSAQNRLTTIAENAKRQGFKIGLMTSVGINHATPAAFYGHKPYRRMYYELSNDLLSSNIDFIAGGGIISPRGKSKTETSIFTLLDSAGYKVVNTVSDFNLLKKGDTKIVALNPQHRGSIAQYAIDSVEGTLSLADYVRKGIELLDNERGFFIMCEGGQIDYACHDNDLATAIHEVLAFEKAVSVAVNFYQKHPDETLIIVTADHETGGLSLSSPTRLGLNPELLSNQHISVDSFNIKIEQWANLPVKPSFANILDSLKTAFGLGSEQLPLTTEETQWLEKSYRHRFLHQEDYDNNTNYSDLNVRGLGAKATHLLATKAGFRFTTTGHSATPVPIYVLGQGQELFKGSVDNTDISKIIEQTMMLKP